MSWIERLANRLKTDLIKSLTSGQNISVEDVMTYSDDFLFDNDRDIPSVAKVQQLIDDSVAGGTTALTFDETDLVSMGDGFYKLPLTLAAGKVILGIKIEIDGGDTFQKAPAEFINDEILNFDTNATQTITIITN